MAVYGPPYAIIKDLKKVYYSILYITNVREYEYLAERFCNYIFDNFPQAYTSDQLMSIVNATKSKKPYQAFALAYKYAPFIVRLFFYKEVDKIVKTFPEIFGKLKGYPTRRIFFVYYTLMTEGIKAAKDIVDLSTGKVKSIEKISVGKGRSLIVKNLGNIRSYTLELPRKTFEVMRSIADQYGFKVSPQDLQVMAATTYYESRGKIDAINRREWSFGLFQIHSLDAYKELVHSILNQLKATHPQLYNKYRYKLLNALRRKDRKTLALTLSDLAKEAPDIVAGSQYAVIDKLYLQKVKRLLAAYGRENDTRLLRVVFDAAIQHGYPTARKLFLSLGSKTDLRKLSEDELIRRFTNQRYQLMESIARRKGWEFKPFAERIIGISQAKVTPVIQQNATERSQNITAMNQQPVIVNNVVPQTIAPTTTNTTMNHISNVSNVGRNNHISYARRFPTIADIM